MRVVSAEKHEKFVKKHYEFIGKVEYIHRSLLLKIERIKRCARLNDFACVDRIAKEIEKEIL